MANRIGVPLEDWRERAEKSWSNVILHNTHPEQAHVIFDKEGYGQVIPPGQRREIANGGDPVGSRATPRVTCSPVRCIRS